MAEVAQPAADEAAAEVAGQLLPMHRERRQHKADRVLVAALAERVGRRARTYPR